MPRLAIGRRRLYHKGFRYAQTLEQRATIDTLSLDLTSCR